MTTLPDLQFGCGAFATRQSKLSASDQLTNNQASNQKRHMLCYENSEFLFPIATFLAGAFIGHRLAISRDEAKERREVIRRAVSALDGDVKNPSPGLGGLQDAEVKDLLAALPVLKRIRVSRLYRSYREARADQQQDAVGQSAFLRPEDVARLAARLASALR